MTGADQTDAVEALTACPDVTCRQAGHCCYPDYGLCGVRRIGRTDRVAAAAVPASPHSPTSRGDQPAMADHTTAQTDAVEIVSAWLDDDEGLRIPDTEWGRSLYDAIRTLLDRDAAIWDEGEASGRENQFIADGRCCGDCPINDCVRDRPFETNPYRTEVKR